MKLAILLIALLSTNAFAKCEDDQWDIWKSAKAREQGMSKESILMHLESSAHELSQERMAKIRALIEEVYSLEQDQLRIWWKEKYQPCEKEHDA